MNKLILFPLLFSVDSYCQDVYVNDYTRSDGTPVGGYYRTAPNSTTADNYSTIGNQNPYTGKWGTESNNESSNYNYYYDAPIQTNPLANTLPPPISRAEQEYIQNQNKPTIVKLNNVVKDTVFELSQNVKDYEYEQTHPSPLSSLDDKKSKFNDFNKAPPIAQQNSDVGMWLVIGMGALIFVSFFLVFSNGKKI